MLVVITMAGEGSRFRACGYDVPKYRIEVKGRTLFSWSMESLRNFFPTADFLFVTRQDPYVEGFIRETFGQEGPRSLHFHQLDHLTDGQATTVLEGLGSLPDVQGSENLVIYNIDTYVEPSGLHPGQVRGDGWVPCFPGKGDAWSFFREDGTMRVVEAREKVRISDHASIGLYHFSSIDLFRRAYEAFFASPDGQALKERYVAPMYGALLLMGLPVYVHAVPCESVHPLGTPDEVEAFAHA